MVTAKMMVANSANNGNSADRANLGGTGRWDNGVISGANYADNSLSHNLELSLTPLSSK